MVKENFELAMALLYGVIDGFVIGALPFRAVTHTARMVGSITFINDNSEVKELVREIRKAINNYRTREIVDILEGLVELESKGGI